MNKYKDQAGYKFKHILTDAIESNGSEMFIDKTPEWLLTVKYVTETDNFIVTLMDITNQDNEIHVKATVHEGNESLLNKIIQRLHEQLHYHKATK